MKKLTLTLITASITTLSFCQKTFILAHQDKKGFVAVSAGMSLPAGQFASCSPTDDQACMAGRGVAFNVAAGYRMVGPVGVLIRAEQHRNAVNTEAMLKALYRNDTDVWTAEADNWSMLTMMAGPYVSIPIGRFAIDARLLAGRALAVLPNTALTSHTGSVDRIVNTTGSQSAALALGGGLSLRYRLGRSLSLLLCGDYSRARFTFTNLTSMASSDDGRSLSGKYTSDRTVSVVSASAGIAFLFGNKYHPF